mgnify:CR=1 FL=1
MPGLNRAVRRAFLAVAAIPSMYSPATLRARAICPSASGCPSMLLVSMTRSLSRPWSRSRISVPTLVVETPASPTPEPLEGRTAAILPPFNRTPGVVSQWAAPPAGWDAPIPPAWKRGGVDRTRPGAAASASSRITSAAGRPVSGKAG